MSTDAIQPEARPVQEASLTRNQIRGFWASWGGWALDGMDSFIYALVLVPSLRDLLPRSGIAATKGNIGFYGGLLFALFLIGWGLAFLWGPVGDKFGRVRTLMLTIVWYSVFTFLSALVTNVWQLAGLRLLAGIGIGGEWAMGGTFVAEEWPESRRRAGAGFMHTGYYVGIFLAALANYAIGSHFGHNAWRVMFAVGGLPALLLAWVRHGVKEPVHWQKKEGVVRTWQIWRPFATLFSKEWRRRTILNSLYMLASISGLWAGTVYVPAAVTALAEAAGRVGPQAAQLASRATMLVAFATILGCLAMPWLAEKLGRRGALSFYFALMGTVIAVTFGKVFYLGADAFPWFFVCLFFLELCIAAGGSITGEHGVGEDKKKMMSKMFAEPDLLTMQRVRNAFDPLQLSNPTKIFPTPRLCGEKPGKYTPHPLESSGLAERF